MIIKKAFAEYGMCGIRQIMDCNFEIIAGTPPDTLRKYMRPRTAQHGLLEAQQGLLAKKHTHQHSQQERQVLFQRAVDAPLTPYELKHLGNPSATPTTNYMQEVKEFFASAFNEENWTLEQTTPERIHAGWRITREFVRTKRLLALDEPIISTIANPLLQILDMWTMPTEIPNTQGTTEYLTKADATCNANLLNIYALALRLRSPHWPWTTVNYNNPDHTEDLDIDTSMPDFAPEHPPIIQRAGLPLLPPPVPLAFYNEDGEIDDIYDPHLDQNLQLYIRAVSTTADYLGLYAGSTEEPDAGRKGMLGLTNAMTVRIAFPTRYQMIAWEYILINRTLNYLTTNGAQATYKHLIQKYGFNHVEVNGLIKMTKRFARDLVNSDRSEDRAIMLVRCEKLMARARTALDLKAEQNSLKQMSAILGLTRTEEDETLSDFVQVVKATTNQRKLENAAYQQVRAPNPEFDISE